MCLFAIVLGWFVIVFGWFVTEPGALLLWYPAAKVWKLGPNPGLISAFYKNDGLSFRKFSNFSIYTTLNLPPRPKKSALVYLGADIQLDLELLGFNKPRLAAGENILFIAPPILVQLFYPGVYFCKVSLIECKLYWSALFLIELGPN